MYMYPIKILKAKIEVYDGLLVEPSRFAGQFFGLGHVLNLHALLL